MNMRTGKSKIRGLTANHALYLLVIVFFSIICGCGKSVDTSPGASADSRGYVVYVYADRAEVMIDLCKSDGVSSGTKLDVLRMKVPGMDEPVKLGEITVEKVGKKMSKAKMAAVTSSLKMEKGDRVLPHPVIIVTDDSWVTSRNLADGWRSDMSLQDERDWEKCEVIQRAGAPPEMQQLIAETGVKAVWHPSVKSKRGDVFFRRVFSIDAEPVTAKLSILCGGKTKIFLNDGWVGETEEWPEISSFHVKTFLNRGKNLIALHSVRDPRSNDPPVLFLALEIKTEFH